MHIWRAVGVGEYNLIKNIVAFKLRHWMQALANTLQLWTSISSHFSNYQKKYDSNDTIWCVAIGHKGCR